MIWHIVPAQGLISVPDVLFWEAGPGCAFREFCLHQDVVQVLHEPCIAASSIACPTSHCHSVHTQSLNGLAHDNLGVYVCTMLPGAFGIRIHLEEAMLLRSLRSFHEVLSAKRITLDKRVKCASSALLESWHRKGRRVARRN